MGEEGSRAKWVEAGQEVTVLTVPLQQQVLQWGKTTPAKTDQREIELGVGCLKCLALTVEMYAQVLKRVMP